MNRFEKWKTAELKKSVAHFLQNAPTEQERFLTAMIDDFRKRERLKSEGKTLVGGIDMLNRMIVDGDITIKLANSIIPAIINFNNPYQLTFKEIL